MKPAPKVQTVYQVVRLWAQSPHTMQSFESANLAGDLPHLSHVLPGGIDGQINSRNLLSSLFTGRLSVSFLMLSIACFGLFGCKSLDKKTAQVSSVPTLRTMSSRAQAETVIQSDPRPVFVSDPADKYHFTIQWPDDSMRTNNVWMFEVASNLPGLWMEADQDRDETNATVRLHGARFIRLNGVMFQPN